MEIYHWVHSVAAIVLIVGSFGHTYMGTMALEATFEAMQSGYCDSNWAREHHDLWYEKTRSPGESEQQAQSETGAATGPAESTDSA